MNKYSLLFLCLPFLSFANNGQIAFASLAQGIVIDGKTADWQDAKFYDIKQDLDAKTSPEDFSAKFALKFNPEEQSLYFLATVDDDDFQRGTKDTPWFQKDAYVLYLNVPHLEARPTAQMLRFEPEGLVVELHDTTQKAIPKEAVTYKMALNNGSRIYEGKIKLDGAIVPNRSIGVDHLFVDVDKKEEGIKYISWGKGGLKQYVSGRLGDVILLSNNEITFNTISGYLTWQDTSIKEDLPTVVKIKSTEYPQLWVNATVDENGHFEQLLPVGAYQLQSAFKITNPFDHFGYNNQHRIDAAFKHTFKIVANTPTNVDTIAFPTFPFPSYLFESEGVLHEFTNQDIPKVNAFVETVRQYYNIPGVSMALVKDGLMVHYETFGTNNLATQVPLSKNKVFQAASVTKPVFAFIVLRLYEKGLIDLDRPLKEYLPFPNIAQNEGYDKLTARIVLSHRSGLPNWAFGGPGGWANGGTVDFLFPPGTKYGYSGEAFEYLGRVTEEITGKNLNQLLQEEVIESLGIPKIYFNEAPELKMTTGHHADGYPTFYYMPREPGVAHSLLTEAKTFAQFVAALAQKKGLSKETYAELTNRLILTEGFESPDRDYWNLGISLGFFVQDTKYGKAIMHGGDNGDFQAEFVLFPEQQMGFVIFCNSNAGHKLGQALGKYLIYGRN